MITRFAPSPTGPLHLGHALSALTVWSMAESLGGTALLRIEDTDSSRVRPEYEQGIYDDLAWLGLRWPEPVLRQSEHEDAYLAVLGRLATMGLIYPCGCTRRQIAAAGAKQGADGLVYPGLCRHRHLRERGPDDALRLNVAKALARVEKPLQYIETGKGAGRVTVTEDMLLRLIGDPILQRKKPATQPTIWLASMTTCVRRSPMSYAAPTCKQQHRCMCFCSRSWVTAHRHIIITDWS